jgi:hypothetical protein
VEALQVKPLVRVAGISLLTSALVLVLGVAPASAAPAQKVDPTAFNDALTGPPPAQVTLPANCPGFLSSDTWVLDFTGGGNGHFYGTMNKNGDWGGGAAEGPASLSTSDGTVQYSGHLQLWFGEGQNSPAGTKQTENGFTLNFKGTGIAGSVSINIHQHTTTNNAGRPTAMPFGAVVSCS